jgi:hypothetical protein
MLGMGVRRSGNAQRLSNATSILALRSSLFDSMLKRLVATMWDSQVLAKPPEDVGVADGNSEDGGEIATRSTQTQGEEEAMRFFTPDLIAQFGSDDDRIALAAHTELERRSEEYSRSLGEVELELPQRFRELLNRYYLHDARVIDHSCLGNGDSVPPAQPQCAGLGRRPMTSEGAESRLISFWMVLELDTPPRDVLVLQYRSVMIEEAGVHQSLREDECLCLKRRLSRTLNLLNPHPIFSADRPVFPGFLTI